MYQSLRRVAAASLAALALGGLLLCGGAAAKSPEEVRAACRAQGRPCVGLVLSGGGARGFAHVGVLRVLEELGVRVDVIAGTSMGSMIGGAYAAGYTVAELEDTVTGVDWSRMLSPGGDDRRMRSWRRKADAYKSLPSRGIEIGPDGAPRLPTAFVSSEELELFLNRETRPVDGVRDLSELAVPFAAPATDLVTGRRVVMQKDCTLHEAMRASMSVPGAFAPARKGDLLLVDGGLVDNLPVALARSMGADVIIAVNVGTPLSGRDALGNVVGVMAQMVNLLTEQNVSASLASLGEGDILITPDLGELTSADLEKSREIMDCGEAAARAAAGRLRAFARPRAEWLAWSEERSAHYAPVKNDRVRVASVSVDAAPEARIADERILESAGIRRGAERSVAELDAAARSVFADGYFDSITWRVEPGPRGMASVVLEPREREHMRSSIRFGGSIESDFDSVSSFNFLFAHNWELLNAWGAEWRNEIQVGETQRFLSDFYQPLGMTVPVFFEPSVSYERHSYDVYARGSKTASARWRNAVLDAKLLLGWEFARLGYVGVSTGRVATRTKREIGAGQPPWDDVEVPYAGAELFLDTLDSVSFPTKGFRLLAKGRVTEGSEDLPGGEHLFEVDALVPWSVGRWTAILEGKMGRAPVPGVFQLGGGGRMVGASYGRWSGSRLEYARLALARNASDWMPAAIPVPVWLGMQAETGRAWNSGMSGAHSGEDRDWQRSLSAYVGVDSLFGPIMFTFGRTAGEGTGLYLLWGYRY